MEKLENRETTNTSMVVSEKTRKKNERIIYFDILNIIACISVILLHCNGIVHTYSTARAWKTSLVVEVVCFWAVPVFLMLTGATLMRYRERYDTKTFFKKRVLKVVIPFIFWSIFMIICKNAIGELQVKDWSIREILNIITLNQQESTYYFMFIIIGVYLTLPILSILSDEKYRKILWYIVVGMFITKSCLPLIFNVLEITYNNYLSILFDSYIIFVILGYLISTMKINKKHRYIIYAMGIGACIFRYGVTYYLSTRDGVVNRLLFDYIQFHSVFLAVAVFVFIKNIQWDKIFKTSESRYILTQISSCSFGIYLIHKLVMHYEIKLVVADIYSIKWRIGGAILTYIVCLCIVYVLKKIPILKKIVP